jgi:DHA1 family bicyclomycin/chloramphenicol resistance-like MFS transporter
MYIALCAEADMYVPAFPEMVEFFATTEDKIQLILSINFIGLCLASLVCGPLSDTFGRRKVLLSGLFLFFISSLGCVFAQSFATMLIWRFLQGMSASVPMVIGCTLFLDKYPIEKASQLVGICNSVISAAMAGAPILGTWISSVFHWRGNFILISVLVGLSLIGSFLFIDESLPVQNRKKFQALSIAKDYLTLISSFKFVGYNVIALLPLVLIVVYISNLSLILVNHMGVSLTDFGYYQASTMGTFVIFSYLGSKLIVKKGLDYTKTLGGIIATAGGASLFLTAMLNPNSIPLICISMALLAAGGSLMVGIFGMMALSLFPDMKGTSSAMSTAIRQLLASGLVLVSEVAFNGTIVPVATIIFGYVCVAIIWYALIQRNDALNLVRV